MKQLVLFILFMACMCNKLKAQQRDSTVFKSMLTVSYNVGIGYMDSTNTVLVTKWLKNDSIEIRGDTILAFKMLVEKLEKNQEEMSKLYDVLGTSVNFTNTVSDYFKKSKAWYNYLNSIKKFGYRRVTKRG